MRQQDAERILSQDLSDSEFVTVTYFGAQHRAKRTNLEARALDYQLARPYSSSFGHGSPGGYWKSGVHPVKHTVYDELLVMPHRTIEIADVDGDALPSTEQWLQAG